MPGDDEEELVNALHEIVDEMLLPFGKKSPRSRNFLSLLDSVAPPFDFSKPNQHDNKAEFQKEFEAVSKSIEHIRGLFGLLAPTADDLEQDKMRKRLAPVVDAYVRKKHMQTVVGDPMDLVLKNVADVGALDANLFVIIDLWSALRERLGELEVQKGKFWNLAHRAPDYYARAIALRLAILYQRETGEKPTVGTSPDSGAPSTSYGRALEAVFALLGIKSGIRTHAEAAIAQLTEEDVKPPMNALRQFLPLGENTPSSDRIREIANALTVHKRPSN